MSSKAQLVHNLDWQNLFAGEWFKDYTYGCGVLSTAAPHRGQYSSGIVSKSNKRNHWGTYLDNATIIL